MTKKIIPKQRMTETHIRADESAECIKIPLYIEHEYKIVINPLLALLSSKYLLMRHEFNYKSWFGISISLITGK